MMVVIGRSAARVLKADFAMRDLAALPGLAAYLVRDGLLTFASATQAWREALKQEMSFTHYLAKEKLLSSECILACCVKHFALPHFELKNNATDFPRDILIAPELIHRHRIIPLKRQGDNICVGLADPTNHTGLAAIEFHLGQRILPMLLAEDTLQTLINSHYPAALEVKLASTLSSMQRDELPITHETEKTEKNDEPIIAFVDSLLQEAIHKHISDIHIEPYESLCRIRFRRDGLLYEAMNLPKDLTSRITTRLKIMANLNIAEKRLPQDGRIKLQQKNNMDIRINSCPTLYGEKIVLRLLDAKLLNLKIDALGLLPAQQELFFEKLSQPQGLILVTGPTGSGKTFTLYSALHALNQIEKNISSVEDPVEIELKGINQVNINPKIGLSFAAVLRTFLRQDPDVMMVGEIRDTDAAIIAMQAAQTGHLVLSTLHTNSAAQTFIRLKAMKIPSYHLVDSISLIIGQRLVRKLCDHCKTPEKIFPDLNGYRAVGCDHCHQGYQGRTGIFELMPSLTISKKAGFVTLWEAGLEKVKTGVTSYAELLRVVEKSCHA